MVATPRQEMSLKRFHASLSYTLSLMRSEDSELTYCFSGAPANTLDFSCFKVNVFEWSDQQSCGRFDPLDRRESEVWAAC
jgi:hypothetical protein